MGLFGSIRQGLSKTRQKLSGALDAILTIGRKVDEEFLEELEEALIAADVGPRLALELVDDVRDKYKSREIRDASEIISFLEEDLASRLSEKDMTLASADSGPAVIMMVGVNGTGKTTTTAKLAKRLSSEGNSVILAAADTFRAAAGEQLSIWADRIGVDLVRHREGADPGAVVFDACEAAVARGADYLIIDTAGRLHTRENLMRELEKVSRVAGKKINGAPHELLVVLDATTGQNALSQAQLFAQGVGVTGLVLAKLDGSAKGGVAISINRAVELPIKFIGVGEGEDDLVEFDPHAFVKGMFEGLATEEEIEAGEEEPDDARSGEESSGSDPGNA